MSEGEGGTGDSCWRCLAAFTVGADQHGGDRSGRPSARRLPALRRGPPPTPKPPPPPPGSPTGARHDVASCSLYANPNNFGSSCLTAASAGDVTTVKDILGKQPPPCWDAADLARRPARQVRHRPDLVNPASPYYLHSCITGLDYDKSLYYQPDAQLNQDRHRDPHRARASARSRYTRTTWSGTASWCSHTSSRSSSSRSRAGRADPDLHRSSRRRPPRCARTTRLTYAGRPRRRRRLRRHQVRFTSTLGGVHAVGRDESASGSTRTARTASASPAAETSSGTERAACGPTRPRPAQQPGQVYPFRAEADWNVYYSVGGVTQQLGDTFKKYDDQALPVYDVQSIVVH